MIFRPKIDFLKLLPNVTPGMPPAFPRTPRARKRLFRALGRLKGRPGEACIMSKNLYKKSKIQEKSRFFVRKSIFSNLIQMSPPACPRLPPRPAASESSLPSSGATRESYRRGLPKLRTTVQNTRILVLYM